MKLRREILFAFAMTSLPSIVGGDGFSAMRLFALPN